MALQSAFRAAGLDAVTHESLSNTRKAGRVDACAVRSAQAAAASQEGGPPLHVELCKIYVLKIYVFFQRLLTPMDPKSLTGKQFRCFMF